MTKVDLCIVCLHADRTMPNGDPIVAVRRVGGQGPYCEGHAASWDAYLAKGAKA